MTLGDNTTCRVLGSGTIQLSRFITLEKVLYVDNLKHNLLSVSQLCDKGLSVCFSANKCTLSLHDKLELEGVRIDRNQVNLGLVGQLKLESNNYLH